MKRKYELTFFYIIFLLNVSFADDSFIGSYSGNSTNLIEDKNQRYEMSKVESQIEMISEHVTITIGNDDTQYYSVDASFIFHNTGNEITVLMGFPETDPSSSFCKDRLIDFKTYVDNELVDFVYGKDVDPGYDLGTWVWYLKAVHFNNDQTRITRVIYKAPYGSINSGLNCGIDRNLFYIYGTGSNWLGPISKITIDIINESDIYITGGDFLGESFIDSWGQKPKKYSYKWSNDNTFRIEAESINPRYSFDSLSLDLHDYRVIHTEYNSDIYNTGLTLLERKAKERIEEHLPFLSKIQLRRLRNDIYAMHGRQFINSELRSYYESIPSYSINPQYDESNITDEENTYIKKIVDEEKKRM